VRVQNDLFKEFNEFTRQISIQECFDGNRDLVRLVRLRDSSGNDLINKLSSVGIVLPKDEAPNFGISTFKEVTSLGSEHGVLIGDVDELKVVLSLAIRNIGQVGIPLLAVFTDRERLIEVVLFKELFGVIV